jgi:hypothetical protein
VGKVTIYFEFFIPDAPFFVDNVMKTRTETVNIVEHEDFEKAIKEVYSQKYEFAYKEEVDNDTCKMYNVKKQELDPEDDIEVLNEFKKTGKGVFLAPLLLTDMCNNSVIPEGTYIIHISW